MPEMDQIRTIAGRIMDKSATGQELEFFRQYFSSRDEQTAMEEIFIPDAFSQPENAIILSQAQKQWMLQHILGYESALQKTKMVTMRRLVAGIAASIMLLIGAYSIWRYMNNPVSKPVYFEVSTAYGQQKIVLMPDSSRVVLNAGSHLRYAYLKEVRDVFLEGEAFFEVTPNKQKAFVVHSGKLAARVLGTSFNVRSYKADAATTVQVKTGRVKVSLHDSVNTHNSKEVILTPSWQVRYIEGADSLLVQLVNIADIAGWTTHKLIFNDQPAAVILNELERIYNIRFTSANITGMARRYTMRLNKMPLTHTLETVGALTGLQFQIKDSVVIVK